nr:hypothetical protein [Tanacetum cinerariifolium]
MTSFSYRLNPRYAIKECSSCGALYNRNCSCSEGSVEDKIRVPKLPENYARCPKCGHPVNGPYCQGCALVREKLEEYLVTYFQNFQNTFESSDDSTNVVNAHRELIVIKTDHSVNPPHIDKCCCECGEALDGIYCQQCICKSYGKGAHIGYNCPPKVPIISNPEPCNQTINNEPLKTLPSFDPPCYSKKEKSVPCVSKPNFVDEYSYIFNPPPQPPIYSCEFCESNAQYGHYCTPQAPFNNPKQGYSQDLNFPQNIHNFQQQSKKSKRIEEEQAANARYWKIPACCDDDDDHNYAITPEETDNSLSMGDEHLDTILATESDEVIKSSVEDLVPVPSESEGIPEHKCDLPFHDNSPPLDVSKDQFEDFSESNNEVSSIDDDSFSINNIDYVEALPPDSELVSSEVMEIVIPKVGGIDDDIPLTIKDDNLREKLLNVNLLIATIGALNDNPPPSSDCKIKSSSTSPKSLLEETNTFHNSLPEFENFYFDLGEISSGSTTTHSDISLSEYDSFIFNLTHEEFVDELAHIISPPKYDRFSFWNLPDQGELMFVLNPGIRENLSTTLVNLPIEDDHSPLLAYVVWIFVAYLTILGNVKTLAKRILSSKSSFPQLQLGIMYPNLID